MELVACCTNSGGVGRGVWKTYEDWQRNWWHILCSVLSGDWNPTNCNQNKVRCQELKEYLDKVRKTVLHDDYFWKGFEQLWTQFDAWQILAPDDCFYKRFKHHCTILFIKTVFNYQWTTDLGWKGKENTNPLLTDDHIKLLESNEFCWDRLQNTFEETVIVCRQFLVDGSYCML